MSTIDPQKQTRLAFAPSDIESLLSVPDIEAKYRLLRNEWLTAHSRYKQAEEQVFQAERSGNAEDIAEARALRGKIGAQLGEYKRLANLCSIRAYSEVFTILARKFLPAEVRMILDEMTCETLSRERSETARLSGQATPSLEDHKALDAILRMWGPVNQTEAAE